MNKIGNLVCLMFLIGISILTSIGNFNRYGFWESFSKTQIANNVLSERSVMYVFVVIQLISILTVWLIVVVLETAINNTKSKHKQKFGFFGRSIIIALVFSLLINFIILSFFVKNINGSSLLLTLSPVTAVIITIFFVYKLFEIKQNAIALRAFVLFSIVYFVPLIPIVFGLLGTSQT